MFAVDYIPEALCIQGSPNSNIIVVMDVMLCHSRLHQVLNSSSVKRELQKEILESMVSRGFLVTMTTANDCDTDV